MGVSISWLSLIFSPPASVRRVPAGALISGLQLLAGEDLRARRRQDRQRLHERQLQEWCVGAVPVWTRVLLWAPMTSPCAFSLRAQRVALTDFIVQEIQDAGEESPEKEIEKINELLQLPRTPAP